MIRDAGDVTEAGGAPEAEADVTDDAGGVCVADLADDAADVTDGADTIVTASRSESGSASRILLMSALSRYRVKEKPLTRTSPPNTR
ncbi:hypothetical protein ACFY4C_39285 [Actinomadura viridis]|uniref:hypothetical protein n=1 Tax=Actinomadura viridis TaxID=58110 RepID=UPI0036C766D2